MQQDKKPGLSWSTPAGSTSVKQPAAASASAGKQLLPPGSPGKGGGNAAGYTGMFVAGLIVGILLAWGWSASHSGSLSMSASSTQMTSGGHSEMTTTTTTGGSEMMGSDLAVPSPQKSGQSVVIDEATIGKPTWVVVYEDRGGAPGNILGAQLFFTSGPGIVTLLRGTDSGETYYVGTSVDNGDHKFNKADDKATTNTDGSLAVTSFIAN